MKFYRKPIIVLITLVILFNTMLIMVPGPFYPQAKEKIKAEMISEYKDEVNAEFDLLQQEYDNGLVVYQDNMKKYYADLDTYNSYMVAYNQSLNDYEVSYAAEHETYQTKLSKYESSVRTYNQAYDTAYENAETALLKKGITFSVDVSYICDYNNHVGNEWYEAFYLNGTQVSYGDSITLLLGNSIKAKSVCTEDDSIPDVGSAYGSVYLKRDYFQSGFTITQNIVVRENRGRYSGNTAGFTVIYSLTPTPYTVTVDTTSLPAILDKPTQPVHNPPKVQMIEPSEPIAPTKPTIEDVDIHYPDVEHINVSKWDIYSHCLAPALIMLFFASVVFPVGCITILQIRKTYLVIQEEKRISHLEEIRVAEEKKKAREQSDFYQPEVFPPLREFPLAIKYASEEEKRINYRFISFLRTNDQYSIIKHHCDFIKAKEMLPYYEYNELAQIQVKEALDKTEKVMVALKGILSDYPNPLSHFSDILGLPKLSGVFPFDFPPFSTKCKDQMLRSFFKNSNVAYLLKENGPIYILTPCYILKYCIDEIRFTILEYEKLKMDVEAYPKKVYELPSQAEVLAEHWTYERKNGGPDLRYGNNPKYYQIYEGTATLTIAETSISIKSTNHSKIEEMQKKVASFQKWRMAMRKAGMFEFLTTECKEESTVEPLALPAFPN